jgi:hypothetical protein
MMLVKSNAQAEAGELPDQKALAEMGAFNDELIKAGVLLAGEGLKQSAAGTRIRYSKGQYTVTDGPFAEARELVAGFWLIRARSKAEALDWAKRAPFRDGEVEVRPLYEAEDFGGPPADAATESAPVIRPAPKTGERRIRYMGLLKADHLTEAGAPPNEKLMTEMGALMEEMSREGMLLGGDGLKPSAQGARVRYQGRERTIIDGPFTESKEIVAGFSIQLHRSKEEAIAFSKRFIQIHVDGLNAGAGECELRPLHELEDFPVDASEKPDGWRDRERAFRDGSS